MRILLVHQSAELYGSDRSFLSALQALEASGQKNVYTVLLPQEGPLSEIIRAMGVGILYRQKGFLRRQNLKKPFSFVIDIVQEIFALRRLFKEFDAVYVNTVVCCSAIIALRSFAGLKYVHVREIPDGKQLSVFKWMLNYSAAKLVFNSVATRDCFGLEGLVLYNGFAAPEKGSSNFKVDGVINLLMIGRINLWKGQAFLLEALKFVPGKVNVRVVGETIPSQKHLLGELKALAVELPQHEITFHQFTETPNFHFAWCDFVIVPSIKPEPFGRVAIEGMAFGKPVVGTRHGGLVEIIEDGVSGFLVSPTDPADLGKTLVRLNDMQPDDYERMSNAAFVRYSSNFSIESYDRNIQSLF